MKKERDLSFGETGLSRSLEELGGRGAGEHYHGYGLNGLMVIRKLSDVSAQCPVIPKFANEIAN